MNIADFFEKTVKSIVAIFYLFVYCIWNVARSPFRAPLRFWIRWKRGDLVLGPQTFQFLCCIAIAVTVASQNYQHELGSAFLRYSTNGKELDANLIRVLIIACGLYVLMDAATYCAMSLDTPRRGRRRRERQKTVLAYLLPSAYLLCMFPYFLWSWVREALPPRDAGPLFDFIWKYQAFVQALLYACLGATLLLWRRRAQRRRPAGVRARIAYRPTASAVVAVLVPAAVLLYSAIDLPYAFYIRRVDQRLSNNLPDILAPAKIGIPFVDCTIEPDGSITAAVVFTNHSNVPFMLDVDSFGLVFAQGYMPGYMDAQTYTIPASRAVFTQTSLKPGERIAMLAPNVSMPFAFRVARPRDIEAIIESYRAWKKSDYYDWMSDPACFMAYDAVNTKNGKRIRVPGAEDNDYFERLMAAGGGDLTMRKSD